MTLEDLIALKSTMPKPRKVCLCGSTRFYDVFREWNLRLTLEGHIVLSIGIDTKSDRDLSEAGHAINKKTLDTLHLFKIDEADEVMILNVGGYIGESTRRELAYALMNNKPVRFLEPLENMR